MPNVMFDELEIAKAWCRLLIFASGRWPRRYRLTLGERIKLAIAGFCGGKRQ